MRDTLPHTQFQWFGETPPPSSETCLSPTNLQVVILCTNFHPEKNAKKSQVQKFSPQLEIFGTNSVWYRYTLRKHFSMPPPSIPPDDIHTIHSPLNQVRAWGHFRVPSFFCIPSASVRISHTSVHFMAIIQFNWKEVYSWKGDTHIHTHTHIQIIKNHQKLIFKGLLTYTFIIWDTCTRSLGQREDKR